MLSSSNSPIHLPRLLVNSDSEAVIVSHPNARGTDPHHRRGKISSLPTTAHSVSTLDSINKVTRASLRDFVAQDKKHLRKLSSRDISHVKDEKHCPQADVLYRVPPPTQCLPTNLSQLEKLVSASNSLGLTRTDLPSGPSLVHTCHKPQCLDEVLRQKEKLGLTFTSALPRKHTVRETDSAHPFVTMLEADAFRIAEAAKPKDEDFVYLGHPSGRQEVENLRGWFEYMKEKYVAEDTLFAGPSFLDSVDRLQSAMVVYKACVKELARQVAVVCVDRGKLLQEVLWFYSGIWTKFIIKAESEFKDLQRVYANMCERLREEHAIAGQNFKMHIISLETTLQDVRNDLVEKSDDCLRLKRRMQHMHESEQKMLMRLMKQQDSLVVPDPSQELKRSPSITYPGLTDEKRPTPVPPLLSSKASSELTALVTPSNVLDDFMQDKAVGDSPLFELVDSEQQTESIDTPMEKETQTDDSASTPPGLKSVFEDSKKASLGETTAESFNQVPTSLARLASSNPVLQETGDPVIDRQPAMEGTAVPEDQFIPPTSQFISSELTANRDVDIGGKTLFEESFAQADQTPVSNITFEAFLPNLSHIESEARPGEDMLGPAKKRYEFILKQVDEKESLLRHIKATIDERRGTLKDLDSALEEKQQVYQQLASELEAAESQYKALAEEKSELEKAVARPKITNFHSLTGIEEVPEADDTVSLEFIPEGADVESWKAGYSLGLEKGWSEGLRAGDDLGYERAISDTKEVQEAELSKSSGPAVLHVYEGGKATSVLEASQPANGSRRSSIKRNSSILGLEDSSSSIVELESPSRIKRSTSRLSCSSKLDQGESSDSSSDGDSRVTASRAGVHRRVGSIVKIKKRNLKAITKFEEFSFQHADLGKLWRKRQHPAPRLLDHFLRKPLEVIAKSAVMSHKMLLKSYSQIYSAADAHIKGGVDSLLIEIAYDEIDKKFVLKKVVEKKLFELIASSLSAVQLRRASMFIRLIGAGAKVGLRPYSKHSVRMYITAYNFMLNSKVGIMVGIDETAEVQLFPMSRAIECLKDRLSAFDGLSALPALQSALEKQAKVDHKRVNKAGLIELELVLEILLQEFDARQHQVQDNLKLLLELLAYSEQIPGITAAQLVLMVRHISPGKLLTVVNCDDGGESLTTEVEQAVARVESKRKDSEEPSEDQELITLEKLFDLSIELGLFTRLDMDAFFGANCDREETPLQPSELSELDSLSSEAVPRIAALQRFKIEPAEVWSQRLALFQSALHDRPSAVSRSACHLLRAELLRLKDL